MSSDGWVKLHRRFADWEWYKTPNMVHLFVHLLVSANHENGRWQGVDVLRGQVITGRRSLSNATGISEKSIRNCLARLELTGEISKKTASKYSIITICKYNEYQTPTCNEGPARGQQGASKGPARGHKQEEEECKKEKKEKTKTDAFQRPVFIPENLWLAFLDNRKFKKLQNSPDALKVICNRLKEAVDGGHTIESCIEAYITSKWQRFDAEWMNNRAGVRQQGTPKTFSQIKDENVKQAMREWAEGK